MGRSIRRVPENWQHPKYVATHFYPGEGYLTKVKFRPMFQGNYQEAVEEWQKELTEWFEGYENWKNGFYIDYHGEKKPKEQCFKECLDSIETDRVKNGFKSDYRNEEKMKYQTGHCYWEDISGEVPRKPNPDDYMPEGSWYQLFETVSEGTPLSPAFATQDELVSWLSTNKDFWGETWTLEQAKSMVNQEWAPSFTVVNGTIRNSQESVSA